MESTSGREATLYRQWVWMRKWLESTYEIRNGMMKNEIKFGDKVSAS